jgi:hypothetical protein
MKKKKSFFLENARGPARPSEVTRREIFCEVLNRKGDGEC